MDWPREHTYGPKRADGQRSCYPVCSPVLGVRVPGGAAGIAFHDKAHELHGDPAASSTPWLPVDLPAQITGKPVVEVYYPAMPVSLDNGNPPNHGWRTDYLDPDAKGATYLTPEQRAFRQSIGGWVRDIPEERPPIAGDWRLADARTEVAHARKRGTTAFLLNMMTLPGQHPWQPDVHRALVKAAAETPDFRVMLMLDMTSDVPASKAGAVAHVAELVKLGGCWTVGGKLALSAFTAERQTPPWYADLFALIKNATGLETWFLPTFQDTDANWRTFAPISAGWTDWGDRNPAWNDPSPTGNRRRRIREAHDAGKLYWQSVSIQDQRPREGIFDESNNTENLRLTWQIAREGNADGALIVARNDYTEGTVTAPSVMHGDVFADIDAIEAQRFRTGRLDVVRDGLYVTHRRQFHAAAPTYPQTLLMRLRGGSPARDTAEALVYLKAPATVEVRSGGNLRAYDLPAGTSAVTCGLGLGYVSARIVRGGTAVIEVRSPHEVKAPWVQDLQYVAAGGVA